MRKKLLAIAALTTLALGNSNAYFKNTNPNEGIGGSVGKKIVYLYDHTNSNTDNVFNSKGSETLEKIVAKDGCSKPALRNALKDGYEIMYLYYKKNKDLAVVVFNDCSNQD